MMRGLNIDMRVTCDRLTLLAKLRENLEAHKLLVAEAVEGFYKKAVPQVQNVLAMLERRAANKGVSLGIPYPQDMSAAYETAISMLEMHTKPDIELSASEYRMLAMDEWDWTHGFLMSNSQYSSTAASRLTGND